MKTKVQIVICSILLAGFAQAQNHNYDNQGAAYADPTSKFVGIGNHFSSNSPANQLEIHGWSTNKTLGENAKSSIRINNNTWDYNSLAELQFGIASNYLLSSISSIYKVWGTGPAGELAFSTSPSDSPSVVERMRITHDGKIGIGTSTPETALEVFDGDITIGGPHQKFLLHTQTWNTAGSDFHIIPMDMSTNTWDLTKVFVFGTDGDLKVHGTVYAEEVIVQLAPFPDYVFEDGYDLMSIGELEDYVAQNGHLPNIPDAEEMESGSTGLGELERLQMEKIEELTLYIFQLKDEIDQLNSRLDATVDAE